MAVTPLKPKGFQIHVRAIGPDGQEVRVRKKSTSWTRRQAENLAAEIRVKIREGTYVQRGKSGPNGAGVQKKVPTFDEFMPEFREYQLSPANKRPNRGSTWAEYAKTYRLHLQPEFGRRRLSSITARDVDSLAAKLASGEITGTKLKANTIANAMILLRRMLNVAKRWELVDKVPLINGTDKVKSDRISDDQWLTRDELARLLQAATDRWGPVFHVGARTGLRLGELQALVWADIDLDNARLLVRRRWCRTEKAFGPPKSGKSREVPLVPDVVEALRAMQGDPADLVFGIEDNVVTEYDGVRIRGRVFSSSRARDSVSKAAEAAGLKKHVHPHMLRKTYASHCAMAGIPLAVLMAWGGWDSESVLARYRHLQPREVEHFVQMLSPLSAGSKPALRAVPAPTEIRGHSGATRSRVRSRTA